MHQWIDVYHAGGNAIQKTIYGISHNGIQRLDLVGMKTGLDQSPLPQPVLAVHRKPPLAQESPQVFRLYLRLLIITMVVLQHMLDQAGILRGYHHVMYRFTAYVPLNRAMLPYVRLDRPLCRLIRLDQRS